MSDVIAVATVKLDFHVGANVLASGVFPCLEVGRLWQQLQPWSVARAISHGGSTDMGGMRDAIATSGWRMQAKADAV